MQIVECQSCKKNILIPGNQLRAIAQCPECEFEFALSDITAGTPIKVAEIIRSVQSDDTSLEDDELKIEGLAGSEPHDKSGIELEIDRLFKEQDSAPDFQAAAEQVSPSEVAVEIPSPLVEMKSLRENGPNIQTGNSKLKRQKKSALVEVAKVAAGGAAGVCIAQLILWWMPGKWRTDPIKLAPKLPAPISFLAPESLRKKAPLLGSSTKNSNHPQPRHRDSSKASDLSNIGLNEFPEGDPNQIERIKDQTDHDSSPPVVQTDDRGSASELESASSQGLLNVPSLTVEDFDLSFRKARAALTELQSDKKNRTYQKKLYQSLAELGRTATYLDRSADGAAERLASTENLLREIASDTYRCKIIGAGASGWIRYRQRGTSGIALTCNVKQIVANGTYFQIKAEVFGRSNQFIDFISLTHPKENARFPFDVGSNVILLGTIVDDPQSQIQNYAGSDSVVVWSGIHWVIR